MIGAAHVYLLAEQLRELATRAVNPADRDLLERAAAALIETRLAVAALATR